MPLCSMSRATLSILTARDMLSISQDPWGKQATKVQGRGMRLA